MRKTSAVLAAALVATVSMATPALASRGTMDPDGKPRPNTTTAAELQVAPTSARGNMDPDGAGNGPTAP